MIENLKRIRKSLGLSQERVAHEIGVSVFSVAAWEKGRREPKGAARILVKKWLLEKLAEQSIEDEYRD